MARTRSRCVKIGLNMFENMLDMLVSYDELLKRFGMFGHSMCILRLVWQLPTQFHGEIKSAVQAMFELYVTHCIPLPSHPEISHVLYLNISQHILTYLNISDIYLMCLEIIRLPTHSLCPAAVYCRRPNCIFGSTILVG
jgi:hypothetical protein